MTTSERWSEAVGYIKLLLVWGANFFSLTNLNLLLSTGVLCLTLGYTWLQIDKLLREREMAIRAARKAAAESEAMRLEDEA